MSVNTLVKCLYCLVVILPLKLNFQSCTDNHPFASHFVGRSIDRHYRLSSFFRIKVILKECQSVFFSSFLYTPIIFCFNNRVVVNKKTIYFNDLGHSMRLFVVDLFKNKPILRTFISYSYSIILSKLFHMF